MAGMKFLATGPEVHTREIRGGAMLYDASRAGNAMEGWLDVDWWRERGHVVAAGEGRGSAWRVEADGRRMILRHYRRGGLIGRFNRDRYYWRGADATRCFREWRLLYQLMRVGMPVPTPLAAGYRRQGNAYRADLLTACIPAVISLAERVREQPVSLDTWARVGRWLRRFHLRGVFHADLNAHNVLLDPAGMVWLIDFDRGGLRVPGWWCDANLVRLRRSLEKLTERLPATHFQESDWQVLLDAYFAAGAEELSPPEAPAEGALA
jgi:3-deoxy-D-manno-octulosonic acid kinase